MPCPVTTDTVDAWPSQFMASSLFDAASATVKITERPYVAQSAKGLLRRQTNSFATYGLM